MKMECVLTHDGENWLAESEFFDLSAPTLAQLDDRLRSVLTGRRLVEPGETAEVFMAFDDATLPAWIRAYAQHYFNRIVKLEAGA